ncbi:hypothetical protein [Arcobacter porcinus]|nr:hypothetical protein [Arcobacter porcinus]OCL89432.1 hypothetical protein AAX27_01963 [Aliarcobacter thereius]
MSNKDHKTNQKNPTTEAYQKMLDNRSRQLNLQDPKFGGNKKDK